jgi:Ni,Fe-hydrogenase I cytochrome b subunit
MESEDYLHALETMGRILLFTPLIMSIILLIFGYFNSEPKLGPDAGFSIGLMIMAGLITLVYASIQRFRKG